MVVMNDITYKFDLAKENKDYLDYNLEQYNFSKNRWLNPIRYQNEEERFGFYAFYNEKIIGGAYGYIDDCYWTYLDLLFVDEEYRNKDIATHLMNQVEAFARENNCVGIRNRNLEFSSSWVL